KDTGIGIAKERHEMIFDRFVQADVSSTRAFEGVGLGLSIVKAYVELLGSQITLDSKLNQGSEFVFVLPWSLPSK
ncbi:MAG TPA: ATP-binding protein, partial [Candidatus Dojkabacteria bacterium]|nr:ATP-binding protein [Candidatus Dojkabacteria bacterium]